MILRFRDNSGAVQTPVFSLSQIPSLSLDKIPPVPYWKQGINSLWSGTQQMVTGGSITLADSAASYQWIDFEYMFDDGVYLPVQRVYAPNGKTVDLCFGIAISDQIWGWRGRLSISGNRVSFVHVAGGHPQGSWSVKIHLRSVRGGV